MRASASPGRLIMVSNRLPFLLSQDEGGAWTLLPGAGGLVSALEPVLRNRGGLWVGWPGTTREVPHLRQLLRNATRDQGYGFRPLQDPWVTQASGLYIEDLLRDIRLISLDGQLVSGADVYRQVLASSRWTQPLALLTRAPLLGQAFDGAYRLFARHRYRVSQACGWAPTGAQPR